MKMWHLFFVVLIWCPFIVDCSVELDKKCFLSLSDGTDCDTFNTDHYSLRVPSNLFGTVCCIEEGLGCFNNSKGSGFECFPGLPDCMKTVRPQFYVYSTEYGSTNRTFDYFNAESEVKTLRISPAHELFVLIHGFGDEWPRAWMPDMVNALLYTRKNVLVVRWTGGSQNYTSFYNYFKAAANVRSVGAAVANVLKLLLKYFKTDLFQMTLVGYSLGAHVAGAVGHNLKGIRRIIALDAAGPLFTCQHPNVRLDPTDAIYVQAIHTNGDSFFRGGFGTMQPLGHVDFYANGGKVQPGCKRGHTQTFYERFAHTAQHLHHDDYWCSHSRVPVLFIEMIHSWKPLSCDFRSFPCSDSENWNAGKCFHCDTKGCHIAGHSSIHSHSGTFYFATLSENGTTNQYCGSQFSISLRSDVDVEGEIKLNLLDRKKHHRNILFQSHDDKLIANQMKTTIIAVDWRIKSAHEIQVYYVPARHYRNLTWTLTDCIVRDSFGKMYSSRSKIIIKKGSTTNVTLF